MAQQIINDGESGLVVRTKLNENFTDTYQQQITTTAVNYTQDVDDDVILVTATATITMLDPSLAIKSCTIRCIAGVTTLTPAAGSSETTSLSPDQSSTLAPDGVADWYEI